MTTLAWILAFAIGVTLGLLGSGGSILTVPVFVYVLGYDPKVAIAMSLPVVGGVALVGAVRHWMIGNVALRTAFTFGLAAMAAAYGGARLARYIPGTVQLVLLGAVMAAAALAMLRPIAVKEATDASRSLRNVELLGLGLLVGTMTGLVGVGGGFLIVPALVVLGGLPMAQTVGTSLTVIAMNTVTGFIGYRGTVVVPWGVVLRFGTTAALGILVGATLTKRVDQRLLRRTFALLLFMVAAWILWNGFTAT